jgi:hypothetical protein
MRCAGESENFCRCCPRGGRRLVRRFPSSFHRSVILPQPHACLHRSVAVLHTILGIEGLVADSILVWRSVHGDLCHNWS